MCGQADSSENEEEEKKRLVLAFNLRARGTLQFIGSKSGDGSMANPEEGEQRAKKRLEIVRRPLHTNDWGTYLQGDKGFSPYFRKDDGRDPFYLSTEKRVSEGRAAQ